jgi:transmembrane sensor
VYALPPDQDDIDGAAAQWAVRMAAGALDQASRRALLRWLDASPAHQKALGEARKAWSAMGRIDAAELGVSLPPPRPARRTLPRLTALAASVLLAIGLGLGVRCGDPLAALRADHYTAIAEIAAVTLPDGSKVRLAPASAIALHYNGGQRRVELLSGQADFTVAPMNTAEPRPFVVGAAGGTARALGTRFMVTRLPDGVEVDVAEHTVEVSQTNEDGTMSRRVLKPGDSIRYGDGGLGAVTHIRYAQAAAWQDGTLVFDRAPLAEVAATLNRYRTGRIVIRDEALAERPVSGVFNAAEPDAALNAVIAALGIRSTSLPPFLTVLH